MSSVLMTANEAASALGLGIKCILWLCQNGLIEAEKLGKSWVFFRVDVEDFKGSYAHRAALARKRTKGEAQ